jgi:hypothetical protein
MVIPRGWSRGRGNGRLRSVLSPLPKGSPPTPCTGPAADASSLRDPFFRDRSRSDGAGASRQHGPHHPWRGPRVSSRCRLRAIQAARRRTYARVEEKLYVIGAAWLAALVRRVVAPRRAVAGRFAVARRAAGRAVVERLRAVVAGLRAVVVRLAVVVALRRAVVVRLRAVVVALRRAVVAPLRAAVVALRRTVAFLRAGLFRADALLAVVLVRAAEVLRAVVRLVVRLAAAPLAVVRFAVVRFAAGRRFAVVRPVDLLLALAGRLPALLLLRAVWLRLAARAGRLRDVDDLRVVGIVLCAPLRAAPVAAPCGGCARLCPARRRWGWPPCLASAPRNIADNRGRIANRHCRTVK